MAEGDREVPMPLKLASAPISEESHSQLKNRKFNYNEHLKKEFNQIFDSLVITDLQRKYLTSRWLEQLLWMESRAVSARKWYRWLRLTTIVGGVILPAIVTLNVNFPQNNSNNSNVRIIDPNLVYWLTFGLSQIVAISAASEQFFNHGERWRHYRRSAESLKTQGWQFFQLSGSYAMYNKSGGHQEAFPLFAAQVEEVIQRDVEVYATQVSQEKDKEEKQKDELT